MALDQGIIRFNPEGPTGQGLAPMVEITPDMVEEGSASELNAYDAVYYAGEANTGSKTIAINLPNDEEVQRAKGTRRLQLKNTVRAMALDGGAGAAGGIARRAGTSPGS